MKKTLLLTLLLCMCYLTNAQVSKTVNLASAGTLSTLLTATEKTTITNLTVTGSIDRRDLTCMHNEMTVLAVLNLSGANVVAYGYEPANEMPGYSFYNGIGKVSLKSITLPSSLTSIGCNVFQDCTGLASITLPSTLTSIYSSAFEGCSGLTSITLPGLLTTIGSYAFEGCSGLTSITLPSTLTSINNSAFSGCSCLTSITLPSNLTSIGSSAFYGCIGLTSITLPNSITSIIDEAFYGCNIQFIHCLGNIPPTLGNNALGGSLAVYVPSGAAATYIAASGWSGFNIVSEKHVTIHNPTAGGLADAIIDGGYDPLASITHLTVTGNINAIDIGQMKTNMTYLTSIDLSGATLANNALPDNAFESKSMLTSVVLPSTVISIGNNAFNNCSNLSCPIPLPASVQSIGSSAYSGCGKLTGSLTIPAGVTSIPENAFSGCSSLSGTLTIPNSFTAIGSGAFYGCSGFSGALNIPLRVTSIGSFAFYNCNGLTELSIGKNTSEISSSAFGGCTGLQKITISRPVPPTIYSDTFSGVDKVNCALVVPTGKALSYQIADYWNLFVVSEADMVDLNIISIQTGTGGVVIENGVTLANGTSLIVEGTVTKTFTFEPDLGYRLKLLQYAGVDVTLQVSNNQFTTPAVTANGLLNVVFVSSITTLAPMQPVSSVKVYTANQAIEVNGAPQGQTVAVYNANGVLQQSVVSQGDQLSLPVKAGAIYLVTVGNQTFKVVL